MQIFYLMINCIVPDIYFIRSNNINHDQSQKIKYWFCSDNPKLGSCEQILSKPLFEIKRFVEKEKLSWNCLDKGHILKSCSSKVNCRIPNCDKIHHTSLHVLIQITTQAIQNTADNNLNNNNLEVNTFLQVIPATISNGAKYMKENALLDTHSNTTLVKGNIVNKIELKGNCKNLPIKNAICNFLSKLSSSFQSIIQVLLT